MEDEAYRNAWDALEVHLSENEKKRVRRFCSLQDVLSMVTEISERHHKSRRKMEKMGRVLNNCSTTIDVLGQYQPGYTALVWGSIRLLLQVRSSQSVPGDLLTAVKGSLNYCNTLGGLAAMLTEIGDNIPRLDMYSHIYPTARMKNLFSKLSVAIAEFCTDAIIFFKKSGLSMTFSPYSFKANKPLQGGISPLFGLLSKSASRVP